MRTVLASSKRLVYVLGVLATVALAVAASVALGVAVPAGASHRGAPTAATAAPLHDGSGAFGALTRLLSGVRTARVAASTVTGTITAGGAPVSVTLASAGDTGQLTFSGSAGERVFVKAATGALAGAGAVTVSLVAPDTSSLGSTGYVFSNGTGFIDTKVLAGDGTYTIQITPYSTTTGTTTVTLYSVPADVSGPITPGGAAVPVTTTTPGQNGQLTFSGTAGQRVFLKAATGVLSGSGSNNVVVKILNPDGSSLGSTGYVFSSNNGFIDTSTLPTTGTYTVLVDPYQDDTGTTTVTLYSVPADVTSPQLAIGGSTATITLTTPGQNASLPFSGSSGEPVKLTWSNATSWWATFKLLKPDGSQLASSGFASTGSGSLSATLPADGTYRVLVDGYQDATGNVTVGLNQSAPYQPPAQTYGTCNGAGVNASSPSRCTADPVNSLTGAFTYSTTDIEVPSPGVPFTFSRSYTSADPTSGRLGPGWSDSYSASLTVQSNGDVLVRGEDGQQLTYARQGDGTFVGPSGARSTLTAVSGGYQLVRSDQTVYAFDATGRLTSILDPHGDGVTLSYDLNGHLATVTDSKGRVETFASNPDGTLQEITLSDGRIVQFGYTSGRLTSVTGVDGKTTTYSYDANGRLATIVDPLGHTEVSNTYDANGRVSAQTDGDGKTTTFAWNASTQTATITDPDGHTWQDTYANNVLVKEIDPAGNTTQFTDNTSLDATKVTAPSGAATSMTYDSRGNVVTATAPSSLGNAQKTFTYDSNNNLTSATDARGNATTYTYDNAGDVLTAKLNGTQIAAYTYNSAGQVLTSTDATGKTTTNTYDTDGNLASTTDPLGNTTTYTYDDAGRVLSRVDPAGNCSGCTAAGHTTTYTYDASGRLLTQTDPLGRTTTYTYDAAGNEATVTDPAGNTTTYQYDSANQLTQITGPDPDGSGPLTAPVTTFTYDATGNKLSEVDPRGNLPGANPADFTTTYTYTTNNQLASVTTPNGGETTYAYDANGNLVSSVDPLGNCNGCNAASHTTIYTYDAAGRLLTKTDPLGHVTTYTYDPVGNLASQTDANNHTTSYTYDAQGHALTVTAPDGGVTTYTYDGNGNKLTRTDAENRTTSYTHDANGHLLTTTDPLGQVTTNTYGPSGNLATTTTPSGGTITYRHDADGELTNVSYSDSTPSVAYTYDADGNRTAMTDGAGTVTYGYDSAGDLTNASRGGSTFSYGYDVDGNVTSRTYPDGTTTSYAYTAGNRLASATSNGNRTSYAYDPAGDLLTTTSPAGNGYTETRSYDNAGRLVEVKNANTAGTLSDYVATLDGVGNPTQIVQSGATSLTTTYTYDVNDRLTGVCYQATCPNQSDPYIRWSYDKVGNRLTETRPSGTTTYAYNADDELTNVGGMNYTYDANGNRTSAGSATESYNLANELTSASAGSATTTYTYDGAGNRLRATTGSQTTNYLWDTNASGGLPQLALETAGSGAPVRTYTYGVRRISMASGGATDFYQYNLLGSVGNLTSGSGNVEWTYSYEPFGASRNVTQNDPNAPTNPMQFTGEYLDGTTGLYDLRARQYDPLTGQFLSRDALGGNADTYAGSLYAYGNEDPARFTDPSGMGPLSGTEEFSRVTLSATAPAWVVPGPGGEARASASRWALPFPLSTHFDGPDQGVDYRPTHPVKAIAAGTIYHHSPAGSFSTPFGDGEAIYEHLDHPTTPAESGHVYRNVYYAEQRSLVTHGHVSAGQLVMIAGPDELGFANDNEDNPSPMGQLVVVYGSHGRYTEPTVQGYDFLHLLDWIQGYLRRH